MARPIDADELKKEVESAFHGALGITVTGAVLEIIDRQPTIDPKTLKPKVYKGEIGEAMENIEDVLDTLTEVGNGATDEDLWKAREKLFEARDVIKEYLEEAQL